MLSKRHTMKYNDYDAITDAIFGADGTEYIVTMNGGAWRDYDWILDNFEPTAKRMADYTHFVYLNHKDECTHSIVLEYAVNDFRKLKKQRYKSDELIDPKFGTVGSA